MLAVCVSASQFKVSLLQRLPFEECNSQRLILNGAQVTIVPREKYPLGQTVLKVNEQRERTHMFSRRYLEEQLMTVLAGALVLLVMCCHPVGRCSRVGFMPSGSSPHSMWKHD